MTREDYISNRSVNSYNIQDLYEFYKEKCTKKCIDINEFHSTLPRYINMGGNFNKYISTRDAHYNIIKITHDNGNNYFF